MRTLIAHRPSPAMIVACIALLVALGGTSVAAVTALAPGSVGTAQRSAAGTGSLCGPLSWPCRHSPASRRRLSRAASPRA